MSSLEVRSGLVEWLRRDLLGPSAPDEELATRPDARYTIGILHPAFTSQTELEADEALIAGTDDESSIDVEPAYGGMRQSAIGISFTTRSGISRAASSVTGPPIEWPTRITFVSPSVSTTAFTSWAKALIV